MKYQVTRMCNGQPGDWLERESPDGSSHTICTNRRGAMVYETREEAADAAGRAMERSEGRCEEYRALPAAIDPEQSKMLSDNAIRLWLAFFQSPGSTLCFGGKGAENEITPEAREALDQLIAVDAVAAIDPQDQQPGSEYYGAGSGSLLDEFIRRPHLNPFKDEESFVCFRKKTSDSGKNAKDKK